MKSRVALLLVLSACVAGSLAACGRKAETAAMPPVEVKAVTIESGPTHIYVDKVGEVRGSQQVDLLARVSGVLMKQHFIDGSVVTENQPLFTIDAREYRARLANSQAQLAFAQANLAHAQQDVERYAPLLAENAISRQIYDSAVAAAREARAQVEASRAVIDESRLAVEFATVRAPFSGRIGEAKVFEGALITAGVTPLASLHKDDPAWVYFSVSEAEFLYYQKRYGVNVPAEEATVRQVGLQLSDGSMYPEMGHINFVASALDTRTGTFALRAEFPNPHHALIPGLFARIRVTADERLNAIAIPDRAVQQQLGRYFVTLVGEGDKAEMRAVVPGLRLGNQWIIDQGLKTGDRVVVEGIQKARPGVPLKVTAITAAELNAPAPAPAAAS